MACHQQRELQRAHGRVELVKAGKGRRLYCGSWFSQVDLIGLRNLVFGFQTEGLPGDLYADFRDL